MHLSNNSGHLLHLAMPHINKLWGINIETIERKMLKQSEKQPLLSVQNCTLFITSVVIDEESINFFSAWHMYPIGKQ